MTSPADGDAGSARVAGAGWVSGGRFGAARCGLEGSFETLAGLRDELLATGALSSPIRRFAKLDGACRMACLVAALTFHDAGCEEVARDVAVLVTNEAGCLGTNRAFYEDYLGHERRSGRGSLFVPTLPSIPASEVSMHFKLVGPTAWLGSADSRGEILLGRAAAMLRRGDATAVLCLDVSELRGVGLLLERATGREVSGVALEDALAPPAPLASLLPAVAAIRRALRGRVDA